MGSLSLDQYHCDLLMILEEMLQLCSNQIWFYSTSAYVIKWDKNYSSSSSISKIFHVLMQEAFQIARPYFSKCYRKNGLQCSRYHWISWNLTTVDVFLVDKLCDCTPQWCIPSASIFEAVRRILFPQRYYAVSRDLVWCYAL